MEEDDFPGAHGAWTTIIMGFLFGYVFYDTAYGIQTGQTAMPFYGLAKIGVPLLEYIAKIVGTKGAILIGFITVTIGAVQLFKVKQRQKQFFENQAALQRQDMARQRKHKGPGSN